MNKKEKLNTEIHALQDRIAKLNKALVQLRAMKVHCRLRGLPHSKIDERFHEYFELQKGNFAKVEDLLLELNKLSSRVSSQRKHQTRFRLAEAEKKEEGSQ